MKITPFARVGRSPLIKAVGLQKNFKEIYYTETLELDRYASGCFSCPNYKNVEFAEFMPPQIQTKAKQCCASCPFAQYKTVYKEHVKYINEKNMEDVIVVSPDLGGVTRARDLADRIGAPIAIIEKKRPEPGVAKVMNLIGDVAGKNCIIIDDIVDTAGSLVEGAKALEEFGAKSVTAAVTHAVLTDPASERIANSNIKELIVTNTIPLPENCNLPNITQLSVAPLLGEAIMRIFHEVSVSNLFDK